MQSALPVATWMMRISVFLYLLLGYLENIKVVNFQRLDDVLVFVYVLVGLLLVVGGFLSKDTLTIIAGALLFLLTLYFLVIHFPDHITMQSMVRILIYLWPASVGLYFLSAGNA
jgi:hypothetical protein